MEPTATVQASPTLVPPAALRPLPEGMSGMAQPGSPTAVREPETRRGTFPPGVARSFTLGHCGLLAPIDFDGSLWDPVAGDDGNGGPLSDEHRIELFNGTEVQLTLVEPNVARFTTPLGAVITLVRTTAHVLTTCVTDY